MHLVKQLFSFLNKLLLKVKGVFIKRDVRNTIEMTSLWPEENYRLVIYYSVFSLSNYNLSLNTFTLSKFQIKLRLI